LSTFQLSNVLGAITARKGLTTLPAKGWQILRCVNQRLFLLRC